MVILPSCVATYNEETGTIELEFAPDMVITAVGYEDAKDQVLGMWRACLRGAWERPCTAAEIEDLKDTLDNIIAKKGMLVEVD